MLYPGKYSTFVNLGKELERNANEIFKKRDDWIYALPSLFLDCESFAPSELSHCQLRKWNRMDEEIRSQLGFSIFRSSQREQRAGVRDPFQECLKQSEPLVAYGCRAYPGCNPDQVALTATHLTWQPAHPHEAARVVTSHRTVSCAQNLKSSPHGDVSCAQSTAGGGWLMRLVSLGVCER